MTAEKAGPTSASILVVGGGISGLTTTLEAAEVGYEVFLVEKNPYLGGRVAQLNQYFPKLCPPTCGLEINFRRIKDNPRIQVLTLAEIEKVDGTPGNYNVTIKIGDTELADDPASALYWLILPVFANDPLGEIDSGFIATERFFFNSFFGGQYDWNFDADGVSCDFGKVGVYAKSSNIAKCWITAQDPLWEATEMYMFDIEYNARTGVAKTVTYPSAVPQTALTTATDFWPVGTMVPFHGNSTNNGITEGLDKLVITFQPASAPGFEGPIVISGLFAIAVLVVIRRRK